jgi:hypothetical protein
MMLWRGSPSSTSSAYLIDARASNAFLGGHCFRFGRASEAPALHIVVAAK